MREKENNPGLDNGEETGGTGGGTSTPVEKKGLSLSTKLFITAVVVIGVIVLALTL